MPSNHLILYRPLLFLPSIFPTIRILSSESVLCVRWPKYWSFSLSINPSNEYSGLISFRIDWFDLLGIQIMLNGLNGLWRGSYISCSRKSCLVSIPSLSLKLPTTGKGLQFCLFVRKQVSIPQYHRSWQNLWDSCARVKGKFINHCNSSSQNSNTCACSQSPDSYKAMVASWCL